MDDKIRAALQGDPDAAAACTAARRTTGSGAEPKPKTKEENHETLW